MLDNFSVRPFSPHRAAVSFSFHSACLCMVVLISEPTVEIVPGRIDGNAPADFAVERDMIGIITLTTIFAFAKEETLASST